MGGSNNSINKKPREAASDGQASIRSLVDDLGNKDKSVREKAQKSIISIGKPTVEFLVQALASPNKKVRWEASKLIGKIDFDWTAFANKEIINALIDDLQSKDGRVRVRARMSLVAIGANAVPALMDALKSKKDLKRWEAAKALGQIGDSSAVEALVSTLEDEVFDVRWLAAEGLIAIGQPALAPMLQMLVEHSDSVWLLEGAHHVIHDIQNKNLEEILQPVLDSLENMETSVDLPVVAKTALKLLE